MLSARIIHRTNTCAAPSPFSRLSRLKKPSPGLPANPFASSVPAPASQLVKWLSSEDLVACCGACRALHSLCQEPAQWRRLCILRWGTGVSAYLQGNITSWRVLYFERDRDELSTASKSGPLSDIYVQMQMAKRSEARSLVRMRMRMRARAQTCGAMCGAASRKSALGPPRERRGHGQNNGSLTIAFVDPRCGSAGAHESVVEGGGDGRGRADDDGGGGAPPHAVPPHAPPHAAGGGSSALPRARNNTEWKKKGSQSHSHPLCPACSSQNPLPIPLHPFNPAPSPLPLLQAIWRRSKRLGDGASHALCSSRAGCSYHRIADVHVCAASGKLHVCGELCRQERVFQGECTLMCAVTGEPVGQSFFVGEYGGGAAEGIDEARLLLPPPVRWVGRGREGRGTHLPLPFLSACSSVSFVRSTLNLPLPSCSTPGTAGG